MEGEIFTESDRKEFIEALIELHRKFGKFDVCEKVVAVIITAFLTRDDVELSDVMIEYAKFKATQVVKEMMQKGFGVILGMN